MYGQSYAVMIRKSLKLSSSVLSWKQSLLVLCLFCYISTALGAISWPNKTYPIRTEWGLPLDSWFDSIAVRPNGQQLLTRLDTPELYVLDLASRAPLLVLVLRFPNVLALTGIAEIAPDVFAINAGNYTLASRATPGSWAVWRVDLSGWNPTPAKKTLPSSRVSIIANITEAVCLKRKSPLSE